MLPSNQLFYKKNPFFDKLLTVLCAPDSRCRELYTNIINSLLDASVFRSFEEVIMQNPKRYVKSLHKKMSF